MDPKAFSLSIIWPTDSKLLIVQLSPIIYHAFLLLQIIKKKIKKKRERESKEHPTPLKILSHSSILEWTPLENNNY